MNQREIINELQQIVSLTDSQPSARKPIVFGTIPEAAQRAKGLIREVESWPPWPWSPKNEPVDAPQQPTARDEFKCKHGIYRDHCSVCAEFGHYHPPNHQQSPPKSQQQPAEPALSPQAPGPLYTTVPEILAHMRDVASRMGNGDYLIARIEEVLAARAIELENIAGENRKLRTALMAVQSPENQQAPPEAPQQPAEPAPATSDPLTRSDVDAMPEGPEKRLYTPWDQRPPAPAIERHIDSPDELLELLAGISSDPQVEGLSLPQKASTMALLHIAKTLPQISYQLEDIDTALEQIGIPINNGAKTLEQLAEMQRTAMDYLMEKSVAATAPQPMRIYVKHSRRRAAEACTSARAAEANEMARKIVAAIEVMSPEDEAEKTVRIALMLRRWRYGDDAEESPDSPQEPS